MASDRGTLSRGAGPDHAVPAAPTTPAGRRLPSAPRERRPALAALAILLIIGGGLAAAALVLATSKRLTAIEITQPVSQGQQIPLSAMQPVQVASGTGVQYAQWSQRFSVSKTFAATNIPAGTVMTSGLASNTGTSLANKVLIGLALKDGQMPSGISQGQNVAVYAVSNSGGGSSGCPAPIGTLLSGDAVVQQKSSASNASNSGTTDVTVAVDPADAAKVSCGASAGGVAIAQLTPGSSAAGAAGTGSGFQSQPGAGPSVGAGSGTGGQTPSPDRTKKKSPAPTNGIG